ncbi:MAG: iron complex outermembrane receptor protein [Pseudomonadales bacterium]|jgi:iron complex outermembrane receptor protein
MIKPSIPFTKTLLTTAVLYAAGLTAPAMAQNNLVLEEVIVTAQKRAQTQQDIAATVNVVTGDVIDDFAVFNFSDIEQLTAGISLTTINSRNSNISMRGITTDPESGSDSAVQVYFNDVSVREDVAFTQMYDLARIEVLRGPQGAVQGRTSPAGAIKMITQQPNMSIVEGYVQTSFSDNDGFNGQFATSLPIIKDELAIRLSGVYDENNGNNVENLTTGLNSTKRASSGRLSIAWQPTDTFSALLVTQYLDRSSADDPKTLVGTDSLGTRPTLEASDRKALGQTDDFDTLVYKLASLELNWDVLGHQLTSISGKQDSTKPGRLENDRAFYQPDLNGALVVGNLNTFQETNTAVDSFSQEFRLSSVDNDTWDYMVGAFYNKQDTTTSFESWNATTIPVIGGTANLLAGGSVPVNREDFAIFTFNTVRLTDNLAMDIGLRHQKVNRFNLTDVDLLEIGQVAVNPALADLVVDGIAATFPISAISDEDSRASSTATTGSFTVRYNLDQDISLYGSYSRSFRAGGISIIPDPNIGVIEAAGRLKYDDETSDAIEFGMKGRFWDGRATANVAIYLQKFDGLISRNIGLQAQKADGTGSFDIPGGLTYNADANMQGLEIDGQILITERWSAGGAFSYNESEYDDGAQSPCSSAGELLTCDIGGDRIAGQPKLSFSLNSEYYIPLDSVEWYVRGLYKYTGDIINSSAISGLTNAREKFDSYDTINLFTGIRAENGQWDVSLWAKNLLDKEALLTEIPSDTYDIAASGGSYVSPTLIPERTIGLTARYNFSF